MSLTSEGNCKLGVIACKTIGGFLTWKICPVGTPKYRETLRELSALAKTITTTWQKSSQSLGND